MRRRGETGFEWGWREVDAAPQRSVEEAPKGTEWSRHFRGLSHPACVAGSSGKAVVEARVVISGDYLDDDQFIHRPGPDGYIATTGIKSVMAAPLIGESGPFGALTVLPLVILIQLGFLVGFGVLLERPLTVAAIILALFVLKGSVLWMIARRAGVPADETACPSALSASSATSAA